MPVTLDEYHRDTTPEELLADLRRVAEFHKRSTVTIEEYKRAGRFHPSTLQRRFGSWFAALDAAGLQRSRVLGISDEALFENLAAVWERLGRQPRYADVAKPVSRFVVETYAKRFGTWRKALSAFANWANAGGRALDSGRVTAKSTRARPVTPRVRWLVMQRDGFRCLACGRTPATDPTVMLHVDHRTSRAAGGSSDLANLQTLCDRCNLGKGQLSVGGV